jgi:hypothetical protein
MVTISQGEPFDGALRGRQRAERRWANHPWFAKVSPRREEMRPGTCAVAPRWVDYVATSRFGL